jgi:hypothetical protein
MEKRPDRYRGNPLQGFAVNDPAMIIEVAQPVII